MYRILLLKTKDKRSQYLIKKYLIEHLALTNEQAKALTAQLPAEIFTTKDLPAAEKLLAEIESLGGTLQINLPGVSYCAYHIAEPATGDCPRCDHRLCKQCLIGDNCCMECQLKNRRSQKWRRYRQLSFLILLVIVIGIAARIHYNDTRKLEWDRTYNVALIEISKRSGAFKQNQSALSLTAQSEIIMLLENWLIDEAIRVQGKEYKPFRFKFAGPVVTDQAPPALPTEQDSWWQRYKLTRAFLDFFQSKQERVGIDPNQFDIKLYLYIYPSEENLGYERQHSVGTTRGRFGVVFIPTKKQSLERTVCEIAHELLHTVGATDKYEDNHSTSYPDGYFEPAQRYPQNYGEIMSLAIPLEPGKEKDLDAIIKARIGTKTAAEIGWTK